MTVIEMYVYFRHRLKLPVVCACIDTGDWDSLQWCSDWEAIGRPTWVYMFSCL